MKVFVWDRVQKCTTSYHEEGGVVVFATSLERALEIARSQPGGEIKEDEIPVDIRDVIGGGNR